MQFDKKLAQKVEIRPIHESDIPGIIKLCSRVYVESPPWTEAQLRSQMSVFPAGQLVAHHPDFKDLLGYSASLIVNWDDYDSTDSWRDFTDKGMFTNHDPENGHTLYGAEVMVDPSMQGKGVGKLIYQARRDLCAAQGMWRIRAGARLRHYHKYANDHSAHEYALAVARGEIFDPTLSFQLKNGFQIIGMVGDYLLNDPESRGNAALIEWLNLDLAEPRHVEKQKRSPFYIENFKIQPKP